MEYLSLDEIIYITRFLSLKDTFRFIKSLKMLYMGKSMLVKNKKLMVIENIYEAYFRDDGGLFDEELKELVRFFKEDIDVEDLICFMANVYPNYPKLKDTVLFDLLKLYQVSALDWGIVQTHFKCGKMDLRELIN